MTSPWARHQQILAIWPEVEKYYHTHQSEDGVFGRMARMFKIHENTLRRKLKGTAPIEPPKKEPPKPTTIKLLNLEDLLTSGKYTEQQVFSLFADTIAHLWNERKSLERRYFFSNSISSSSKPTLNLLPNPRTNGGSPACS